MKKRINYPMPGERWQHYKGGIYEIITLANHSETQDPLVVYKSIPFGSVYARPLEMWKEPCEIEGNVTPRFQKI